MARTRSIKPEFWDDEKLATTTSRDARLTFIGMWNQSDDYSVVKGSPIWLKNKIYPYDDVTLAELKTWLAELEAGGFIAPFAANGESYYYIKNFLKHQRIDKPSKTVRNPQPPEGILKDSPSSTRVLGDETETETESETETLFALTEEDLQKEFDENFWKVYPARNGKKVNKDYTYKQFREKIKPKERPLFYQATKNYAASDMAQNNSAKDPHRFISNRENAAYWREWIEPEVKPEDIARLEEKLAGFKERLAYNFRGLQSVEEHIEFQGESEERLEELKRYKHNIEVLEHNIEVYEKQIQKLERGQ